MSPLQTSVLGAATIVVAAGAAFVLHRELTAPGRRRVGAVRDMIEVLLPIAGLGLLLVLAWTRL